MFKSYYVFAVVVALVAAVLNFLYARTLETPDDASKTFFKTLVAALIAGLVLAWFVSRPDDVATEPFVE